MPWSSVCRLKKWIPGNAGSEEWKMLLRPQALEFYPWICGGKEHGRCINPGGNRGIQNTFHVNPSSHHKFPQMLQTGFKLSIEMVGPLYGEPQGKCLHFPVFLRHCFRLLTTANRRMHSRSFGAWLVQFWDSGRVGFMQILEILDLNPYRLYTLKLHWKCLKNQMRSITVCILSDISFQKDSDIVSDILNLISSNHI